MEREKLSEIQYALAEMNDMIGKVKDSLLTWQDYLDKEGLFQYNYEFLEAEQLAKKLGKEIYELKNKIEYHYENK